MASLAFCTSSCSNNVIEEIKVESITLTSSAYELFLDESATLTVEIKPENAKNKNYSFSMNPTSLGQIENNIFTAKAVGTVEITVISDLGLKSSININIKEKEIIETYDDNETIINSLSSSTYSSSIKVEPNTLGLENGDVGVNKDKLENEELYNVSLSDGKVYKASEYNIIPNGENNTGNLINLIDLIKNVEGTKIIYFDNETYHFSNTINITAAENL